MTNEQAEEWFQRTYVDTGFIVDSMKRQQQNEIDQIEEIFLYDKVTKTEEIALLKQINEVKQRQLMRILKYGK